MSIVYTRLNSIFSKSLDVAKKTQLSIKKPPPPPPPLPSIPPTQPIKTRKTLTPKQRRIKSEIKKFLHSSQFPSFRKKYQSYATMVRRLIAAEQPSLIHQVLDHQKKYEEISNERFTVQLISLYGKASMFEYAHRLFDEMPDLKCERTVLSLNALLSACIRSKEFDKFNELLRDLPAKLCVEPDVVTYNTVIKAFCEMGSLDKAISILDLMEEKGLHPNLISYNTLLDELFCNGRFADGEKIWALMKTKNVDPNIRSYNSKLRGLVGEERLSEAVELFDQLISNELKPDVYSFNPLIKGFCSDGNVKEVKRWYEELLNCKCEPDGVTIRTILPFLCHNGETSMALAICKETIRRRFIVDTANFQLVVDRLVSEFKIEEAMELVKLGRSNDHFYYKLELNLNK